jgi:hypothetical protein
VNEVEGAKEVKEMKEMKRRQGSRTRPALQKHGSEDPPLHCWREQGKIQRSGGVRWQEDRRGRGLDC